MKKAMFVMFAVISMLVLLSMPVMAGGFGVLGGNLSITGSYGDKYIATGAETGITGYQNTSGFFGSASSEGIAMSGIQANITGNSATTVSQAQTGGVAQSIGNANAGSSQAAGASGLTVNGLTVGGSLNVSGFGLIH
jgi:hypothetical protein